MWWAYTWGGLIFGGGGLNIVGGLRYIENVYAGLCGNM